MNRKQDSSIHHPSKDPSVGAFLNLIVKPKCPACHSFMILQHENHCQCGNCLYVWTKETRVMSNLTKQKAKQLFDSFYMILFDSETDKSQEILTSLLSVKCAINSVETVLQEYGDKKDWSASEIERIRFWIEVKNELKNM